MKITKWLKDEDGVITNVEWHVIRTSYEDSRGYQIDGETGTWLTIMSTFIEDVDTNILSINPYNHPALSKYTELTEEEALQELEEQRKAQEERDEELRKQYQIRKLQFDIEYLEKQISKCTKILTAVKQEVLYNGDLELMEALHNFNEDTINKDKETLQLLKSKLEELQADGE